MILTPPDSAVLLLQTLLHKYSQHTSSGTADVAGLTPPVLATLVADVDRLHQNSTNDGSLADSAHRSTAQKRGRPLSDAALDTDREQQPGRKRSKPSTAGERAEEYLARRVKALQQHKQSMPAAGRTSRTGAVAEQPGCSIQAMQAAGNVDNPALRQHVVVDALKRKQPPVFRSTVSQCQQPTGTSTAAAMAAGLDAVIQQQMAAEARLGATSKSSAVCEGCSAEDSSDDLMELWIAGLQQEQPMHEHDAVPDDADKAVCTRPTGAVADCEVDGQLLQQGKGPAGSRSPTSEAPAPPAAPAAGAECVTGDVKEAAGPGAAATRELQSSVPAAAVTSDVLPQQPGLAAQFVNGGGQRCSEQHQHQHRQLSSGQGVLCTPALLSVSHSHRVPAAAAAAAEAEQVSNSPANAVKVEQAPAAAAAETIAAESQQPQQQQQQQHMSSPSPPLPQQPPSVVSSRPPYVPLAISRVTQKAASASSSSAASTKRFTLASLLFAVPELPIKQQSVAQAGQQKQQINQQTTASAAQRASINRRVTGGTTGVSGDLISKAASKATGADSLFGAGQQHEPLTAVAMQQHQLQHQQQQQLLHSSVDQQVGVTGTAAHGVVCNQGPPGSKHIATITAAVAAAAAGVDDLDRSLSSDEEGEIADDGDDHLYYDGQQQQHHDISAAALDNGVCATSENPRKRKKSRGGRQVRQRQQRAAAERAAASSGGSGAQGLYAEIKQWEKENNKARKQQQGSVDAARELRFSITEKPPCRFWQLGRCSKGSECPYPHAGQPASKLIACKFHQRGACKLGDKCRFSHDDVSRQPCPDQVLYHRCRCAEGVCPYSHQQVEPEVAQALRRLLMKMQEEEQQQQQQQVSGQQSVVTKSGQQQQGALVVTPHQQQQQQQLQALQHPAYPPQGGHPLWHGQQQPHQVPPGIAYQFQQQPIHSMPGHSGMHHDPKQFLPLQHAGQQRPPAAAWSLPGNIMRPW